MNIVLCALNAKFIHSSLALYSIAANLDECRESIYLKEFTINHSTDFILSEIYRLNPEIIAFSCYIWNIDMVLDIVGMLEKVLPNTKIILGGPEVSYEYDDLFDFGADYIIIGEGEKTMKELLEKILFAKDEIANVDGIAYRHDESIISTKDRIPTGLDELPFAYPNGFEEFSDRIIYYETSRGCPFNCQYCLSSAEKGVRFLSIDRAKKELDIFLNAKIRQVKFVDRTFNCNKIHAIEIWKHIIKNDNFVTNFHFEIAADLLDDEMVDILKNARRGQIQFEVGVQSTNDITLSSIKRKTDLQKLFANVKKIKDLNNINLHLDLIAGLPNEDYNSFKRSFNDIYYNYPEQLQLGFLKLLKGSGLREDALKYGIVYREKSPYEVLYTDDISFKQMLELKEIEEMVELYYNSNKFLYSIRFISESFENPFDFFRMLSLYWRENNYHLQQHNKMKIYTILYEFCVEEFNSLDKMNVIKDLLRFDMFLCDNIKNLPHWLDKYSSKQITPSAKAFFDNLDLVYEVLPKYKEYNIKQINRMCAIQKFDYNIIKWIENDFKKLIEEKTIILFDYKSELSVPGLATYHSNYIDITRYASDS